MVLLQPAGRASTAGTATCPANVGSTLHATWRVESALCSSAGRERCTPEKSVTVGGMMEIIIYLFISLISYLVHIP